MALIAEWKTIRKGKGTVICVILVAEWKTIGKGKGTVACIGPVEAIVLRTLRSGAILGGTLTGDCKGGTTKGVDSGTGNKVSHRLKVL